MSKSYDERLAKLRSDVAVLFNGKPECPDCLYVRVDLDLLAGILGLTKPPEMFPNPFGSPALLEEYQQYAASRPWFIKSEPPACPFKVGDWVRIKGETRQLKLFSTDGMPHNFVLVAEGDSKPTWCVKWTDLEPAPLFL
jgi:hypothetical protein